MAKIDLKHPIVDEIKSQIADATSLILVGYQGLSVYQDSDLRQKFRDENIVYKVYKLSIISFAIQDDPKFQSLIPLLENLTYTAIALGYPDSGAPERVIYDFVKEHRPITLKLFGGVIDGICYDQEALYAKIEDDIQRERLLQKLVAYLSMPIISLESMLLKVLEVKCADNDMDYKKLLADTFPTRMKKETKSIRKTVPPKECTLPKPAQEAVTNGAPSISLQKADWNTYTIEPAYSFEYTTSTEEDFLTPIDVSQESEKDSCSVENKKKNPLLMPALAILISTIMLVLKILQLF